MRLSTTLFLCLASFFGLQAQFEALEVPVTGYDNPFAGGLNAPQFSNADLNNDGLDDLVVFDRAGSVLLCFLGTGSGFEYAPEFARNFPEVKHFLLMRDYDQDGVMDLFTHFGQAIAGMVVHRGYYEDGVLKFIPYPLPGGDFAVLEFSTTAGGSTNIYVNNQDVPGLRDLDGDGDLDIVSFNVPGTAVDEYLNQSQEMGYGNDSLLFDQGDICWGKFVEDAFNSSIVLSDSPNECADTFHQPEEEEERGEGLHPGSTLLVFDEDGDGDQDLLVGDVLSPRLTFLNNGGTSANAYFTTKDDTYPSNGVPINLTDFPAAFLADVNADGLEDLLVSPALPNAVENVEVVWYYENTGTTTTPEFNFQQTDFLVEGMIDVGSNSAPAFFDYNGDGLFDLLVGNSTYFQAGGVTDSRLALFTNIGTATAPAFELTEDNYLNFQQYSTETGNFAPTAGDLDGDGDQDLLVGDRNGNLFFVENTGGPGNPASFPLVTPLYAGIDVGITATPTIADLNRDGLQDLLIGERNGNLNYFQNTGSVGNPQFESDPNTAPNNFFFGSIDTGPGASPGSSAPEVLIFEDRTLIVVGTENTGIRLYEATDDLSGPFDQLDADYGQVRAGDHLKPALADLNNDGVLDMVVGNARGGLVLVETDLDNLVDARDLAELPVPEVFPNPAGETLTVRLPTTAAGRVRVMDVLGTVWLEETLTGRGELDLSGVPPGRYVVLVEGFGAVSVVRL